MSIVMPGQTSLRKPQSYLSAWIVLALATALAILVMMFPPHHANNAPMQDMTLRGSIDTIVAATPVTAETAVPHPPIPTHPIRTMLLVLHVLGLVIGMGSALFLDIFLMSRLYHTPLQQSDVRLVIFGAKLVFAGLAALWISGLGFLIFYYNVADFALDNPKLWAKLIVVTILTLNGIIIHKWITPILEARKNKPVLYGNDEPVAALMIGAAVVSATGWFTAALFGLVKELNYSISCHLLVVSYFAIVAGILLIGGLGHNFMSKRVSNTRLTD